MDKDRFYLCYRNNKGIQIGRKTQTRKRARRAPSHIPIDSESKTEQCLCVCVVCLCVCMYKNSDSVACFSEMAWPIVTILYSNESHNGLVDHCWIVSRLVENFKSYRQNSKNLVTQFSHKVLHRFRQTGYQMKGLINVKLLSEGVIKIA